MVLVSTAAYFATDALFKSLHGLDNAEFVREFSRIMRKKGSPDTPKGSASILFKNWEKNINEYLYVKSTNSLYRLHNIIICQ